MHLQHFEVSWVMAGQLKNTLKKLKLESEAGWSKWSHLVKRVWLNFAAMHDPQSHIMSTQDWHEHLKVSFVAYTKAYSK